MAGASRRWSYVGVLGIVTAALILSFYSVIGGLALAYAFETLRADLPAADAADAQARFDALLASPLQMAAYHAAFMAMAAGVVGRGIVEGIENASKVLMPALIAVMVLLSSYSMMQETSARAFVSCSHPTWRI
jgi:NSS family neurotransmitter:Na+ symporter